MTNTPIYTEISGLEVTDVIEAEGLDEPKGGDLKTDDIARPKYDYGSIYNLGRNPRTWTANFRFLTEEDLDEFMDYCNNAVVDAEFFPRRSDRAVYMAFCHAEILKPLEAKIGGVWTTFYKARATIKSREPWMHGPDQGIPFTTNAATWTYAVLTNSGHMKAGLDYLCISGNMNTNVGYHILPPGVLQEDRNIFLASWLLGEDAFEVDRWGHVRHTYRAPLAVATYAQIQADLWGSTYCTGGSVASHILTIGNSGKLIMPFAGPLPISGENPYIEIYVTTITGTPSIKAGVADDMSDLTVVSTALKVGYNKIYIPGYIGHGDFFAGIVCGVSDSISMSALKGVVNRYIAKSSMPLIDVGETAWMQVYGNGSTFDQLYLSYRDLFWM
jgi:hypothetical protein